MKTEGFAAPVGGGRREADWYVEEGTLDIGGGEEFMTGAVENVVDGVGVAVLLYIGELVLSRLSLDNYKSK